MTNTSKNGVLDWREYRHYWLPQLIVLVVLAVLVTAVFWLSDLDIQVARLFFHPENPKDPWFEEHTPLWEFCYWTSPLLAAALGFASLSLLAASHFVQTLARYRVHALFVLLVVIIGPGLLVNAVFKEHWDRARPRQVVEFGGTQAYTPPLKVGEAEDGKSFPAGHSSVAFSFIALWFVLRRRRLVLAWVALGGTLAMGAIYGTGRMAAGAHFLSDVLWSALIPSGVALALYYFVLNVPAREDRFTDAQPRYPILMGSGYAVLAATLLLGVLVLTPFKHNWTYIYDTPLRRLSVEIDEANVALRLTEKPAYSARIKGKARGFGLPGNRLAISNDTAKESQYTVAHKGLFTEIDSRLSLRVNPRHVAEFELRVQHGDVKIRNARLRDKLQLTITAPNGTITWVD